MRPKMLDTLIVSPEQMLFSGQAKSISVPGANGSFTIYPQHCPLLSSLSQGTVVIEPLEGEIEVLYLESGTVAIRDNTVKVFADIVFKAREEQEALILREREKVSSQLDQQLSAINTQELLTQLSKLNAQLTAIQKLRKYKKR